MTPLQSLKNNRKLLSQRELCRELKVSPQLLKYYHKCHLAPMPQQRIGSRYYYSREEVDAIKQSFQE
jgi:DNA-binding transcriptional MerR regulator